jgi:hypothetical protein
LNSKTRKKVKEKEKNEAMKRGVEKGLVRITKVLPLPLLKMLKEMMSVFAFD